VFSFVKIFSAEYSVARQVLNDFGIDRLIIKLKLEYERTKDERR
jgi:hypothetical protein